MPILNQSLTASKTPEGPPSYPSILAALVADKWVVTHEGPSGAQMKRPKKMMVQTQLCFVAGGVLLFFYWPLGLILLLIATLDYCFFTKERQFFLSRDLPALPPPK